MTSIIRVGQSKFVAVPIDEDSHEQILNCIQTLNELEATPTVHKIFLKDTKAAYTRVGSRVAEGTARLVYTPSVSCTFTWNSSHHIH
jgi:vesicle coat complex subunit